MNFTVSFRRFDVISVALVLQQQVLSGLDVPKLKLVTLEAEFGGLKLLREALEDANQLAGVDELPDFNRARSGGIQDELRAMRRGPQTGTFGARSCVYSKPRSRASGHFPHRLLLGRKHR